MKRLITEEDLEEKGYVSGARVICVDETSVKEIKKISEIKQSIVGDIHIFAVWGLDVHDRHILIASNYGGNSKDKWAEIIITEQVSIGDDCLLWNLIGKGAVLGVVEDILTDSKGIVHYKARGCENVFRNAVKLADQKYFKELIRKSFR